MNMQDRWKAQKGSCSLIMLLFAAAVAIFFYLKMSETYFKGSRSKISGEPGEGEGVQLIITPEDQRSVLESTQKKIHDIEKMHQEQADKIMDGFREENYQ
jgi:hypothetical protein